LYNYVAFKISYEFSYLALLVSNVNLLMRKIVASVWVGSRTKKGNKNFR
jgi:hypothetical protein